MKTDLRSKILLGAALTGMLTASNAVAHENMPPMSGGKVECNGINACKGQGECGGKGHSCAGQNECKGKGWLTLTKEDCTARGGTFKEEKKK